MTAVAASSTTASLGPVSAFVRDRLRKILDERRVVVWYDAERAFGSLVGQLQLADCVVVSEESSRLRGRREAEAVYRRINAGGGAARQNLLIYLPRAPSLPDERLDDPFEAFARCGTTFGVQDGEKLPALAQLALPDRAGEIDRLFRDGTPSLAVLDALPRGARYPLVRQALGTDSPSEAIAAALGHDDADARLAALPGALPELLRLLAETVGFPVRPAEPWQSARGRLASFLLVGELAFDLPAGLPAALETVAHPEPASKVAVFDALDRLRETDAGREAYARMAREVEGDLRLSQALGKTPTLGRRDTFSVQERVRLRAVVAAARSGDLATARELSAIDSVWRREPERGLLWQVALRGLTFLDLAATLDAPRASAKVQGLIDAYVAPDGGWTLDRAQRLVEQGAARCNEDDEVEPLLQVCRERYRAVAGRTQQAFQEAVAVEGWPPEDVRRQAQVFDSHVAPELSERRKVAYFLVDSLRYEMGRDLATALEQLGAVTVEVAAATLPTTTPVGMAALLPGADGALSLVERHGDLVPALGDTPLPTLVERLAFLRARLGDRVTDLTLDELLTTPVRRLPNRLGAADLVLVRTREIDSLGEGGNLLQARRLMSEVIGDLHQAALRLAALDVRTFVFAADHGHVLVPEILPGEAVAPPPGEWLLKKRRVLIGKARVNAAPGVVLTPARNLGIVGADFDVAAAVGFKTFQDGPGYFHEGISLQECLVPVVVARPRRRPEASPGDQVALTYRSDRVTSNVFSVKVALLSMLNPALAVRVDAYGGTGGAAPVIGSAGDCDARDPVTGEVALRSGAEVPVPIVIQSDYSGDTIEVRATDPRTGVVLARLPLKNARLE